MIEVIESTVPEVLSEAVVNTIVESSADSLVIETTSSGPDILAETFTTDVVIDLQTSLVVATEIDTAVVETAEQGPPGSGGGAVSEYTSESTPTATADVIPLGYQKLIYGEYEVAGTLEIQGKLVLL